MRLVDAEAEIMARWRADPVLFAQQALKIEFLDPWQQLWLRMSATERFMTTPACHGPGKTFVMAVDMLCTMYTTLPFKGGALSATREHLELNLWAELARMWKRMDEPLRRRMEMTSHLFRLEAAPEECFIAARAANKVNSAALQGLHADTVKAWLDEAAGIDDCVFEAGEGSDSAGNLWMRMAFNPTELSGFAYRSCHEDAANWYVLRVSHEDSSRVSDAYVERMVRRYGANSNQVRVRCYGLFPTADQNSAIPLGLVEAAMKRDVPYDGGDIVWGLDVGSTGDPSVLIGKYGNKASRPRVFQGLEEPDLIDAVAEEWEQTPPDRRPLHVNVDGVGVGDGVVPHLTRKKIPARHINCGLIAPADERGQRARDAMALAAHRWLRRPDSCLPAGEEDLKNEIAAPRLIPLQGQKDRIETKDELGRRGISSTNHADALFLCFAERWMIPSTRDGALEGPKQRPARRGSVWSKLMRRNS